MVGNKGRLFVVFAVSEEALKVLLGRWSFQDVEFMICLHIWHIQLSNRCCNLTHGKTNTEGISERI
jgi:hypothetical protein